MKLSLYFGGVLGLAVTAALIGFYGFAEIGAALRGVGWGVLAVIAFHFTQLLFSSLAWRSLMPSSTAPALLSFIGLRWIREAVNNLLPVAQIGGEFVAVRLLRLASVPLSIGGASVAVDLTMEMASQIIFTLFGLALLLPVLHNAGITQWAIAGVGVAVVIVVGFVSVQRFGLSPLISLAAKTGWSSLRDVAGLHQAIEALYKNPARIGLACGYHLISWFLGGFEVMLALRLVGVSVDLHDGLIIESLGQALRAVGFAIPASLGVQEGGYVLICGVLGISPEAAIELSLLKRIREVALGVPALMVWQGIEGRRLVVRVRSRQAVTAATDGD